ncbi:hypothetical protein [Actinomadura roseirufa]|uniref:hypothetical protein n=1 Tax=Actinomadura roseirufa TaxID=2094049 RepID=UPI0010413779|nr:hypothetical protein [Actinomadura roseirufa]
MPPTYVEVRRRELQRVAEAMRKDLEALKYSMTALQVQAGKVGAWDVAQQLGPKVGTAHQNMIASVRAYCEAYEAVIQRLERTARNYDKSEEQSKLAVGQTPKLSGTTPWQNQ